MYIKQYINTVRYPKEEAIQYQEKRGIVFLASNAVVSALYALYIVSGFRSNLAQAADTPASWAAMILIFIAVQILVRIVVTIIFAIIHKIRTDEDSVDREDELDKLIGLKASRIFGDLFMAGVALALLGQVLGLPLSGLFLMIGATVLISGLSLDLCQLILYRRGI
jgi:hypothetical protein